MNSPLPWPAYVPLAAPLLALFFGFFVLHRRRPGLTHWPILASCAAVTAASWWLAWKVLGGAAWDQALFIWIPGGNYSVEFGLRIDGLSAAVLAMVSLVSALIHAYAVGYMEGDPGFSRFFLYFHLFFFFMVGLLLSNNYLQLYLFWEGVGLASFLLIGFWHGRASARAASWKAFLTNRIGDLGFMLAVLLMLRAAGTTHFEGLLGPLFLGAPRMIPWIALLLFWGACAKSAQFPLYVWLPDAMEGPTPVSALMHAATMVTAGVFLMARSWPLLDMAPRVASLVASVGALTAVAAALFAAVQKDLKRILAYSTVSHLGLMMLAIGAGNVFAAVFHLIAHGFFKALLFLCAGNVIHAVAHEAGAASVDQVGGLSKEMPLTLACFLAGALALAGAPPFSGFFSKDLILEAAWRAGNPRLKFAGLLIAAGSSVYIFRMLFLVFFGRRPEQAARKARAHEPNAWMRWPVVALAVGAAGAGVLGPSGVLARMLGEKPEPFSWGVSAWGLSCAAAGFAAAYAAAMIRPSWDWEWRRAAPDLERWLASDLGWQPLTARLARLAGRFASWLAVDWESRRWDRFTESLADTCLGLGEGASGLSRGVLNDYLWWMLAGAAAFAFVLVLCV